MDELFLAKVITVAAGVFVGLVFGALSSLFVLFIGYNRRRARASRGWPAARGQITASAAAYKQNDGSGYYYPVVTYSYEAAGRPYTSSRIAFGLADTSANATPEAAIANYPLGSAVTVYYNPANPADAVLERRTSIGVVWAMAIIVFVLTATFPICFVLAGLSAMSANP